MTVASATGTPVEKLLAKAKLGAAAAVPGPALEPVYAWLREPTVSRVDWIAWAEAVWGWARASRAALASKAELARITGAPAKGRSWGKPGAMASL